MLVSPSLRLLRGNVSEERKTLVMGMGNLQYADEGIGIHVAQRMMEMALPLGVEVMDAGAVGHDMIFYIEDFEKVIAVDAVKQGQEPGSIYKLQEAEFASMPTEYFTLFHLKLVNAMGEAALLGKKLDVVMFGVEPKITGRSGLELSEELEARVPEVIARVLEEIEATA